MPPRLISTCDDALARLGGDEAPSLTQQLQRVRSDLGRMQEHEPRLGEVDAMLDAAAIQVDEAVVLLERVRADLDVDPAQFDALERRLARLHELARKHRVAPQALATQRDAAGRRAGDLADAPASACRRSTARSRSPRAPGARPQMPCWPRDARRRPRCRRPPPR